jgi:Beta-galactosidase
MPSSIIILVILMTIIFLSLVLSKSINSTATKHLDLSKQINIAMVDTSHKNPSEDDWWLPAWVEPLPDVMGFYGPNPEDVPKQTLKLVTFRWRDVNPREGVYDWSILENALKQPHNIYIRLENSDVIHCPEWLQKKYPDLKPLKLGSYEDNFGVKSEGMFYPMWHPGFKKEFKNLLLSFKEHQFGSHPHLKFAYIPGAWKFGEFSIELVENVMKKIITPNDYLNWFKEIIDAYVDAFGKKNAHKLMYTGYDALCLCDGNVEWRQGIDRKLFNYVIKQGGSTRFGLLEKYNFLATDMPHYGIPVVTIGDGKYMMTDESAPLIASPQRFIGSESEELGDGAVPISTYQQLKLTALKNLQARVNVVFLARDLWSKAPELHNYMLKTLGRHYYDSPDAWTALREGKDVYQLWTRWNLGEREHWWIRNFERWLIQREIEPDGKTVRTDYVKTPVMFNEESYEARRTDLQSGNNYIYFGVDDKFMKGGNNHIQIKVTYLDNNNGQWWIEYDASRGDFYKKTSAVANRNDGKWKTVTFVINDATFLNHQNGNMDFRIYNGGQADLTVRFARVIKMERKAVRKNVESKPLVNSFS